MKVFVSSGQIAVARVQQLVDVVVVCLWRFVEHLTRVFADDVVVLTHPLLAALAGRLFQMRFGTAPGGKGDTMRAERHAAHYTVHATALMFTAGLEVLAVLVHAPTELAWTTLGSGYTHTQTCTKFMLVN